MSYRISNTTRQTVISARAQRADSFFSRMKGLLGRESLLPGEGLIITRCKSIHMLFMKFPIDVLFVSKEDCIVGFVEQIQPYQLSPHFFSAAYAIELPVGQIKASQSQKKDKIRIEALS